MTKITRIGDILNGGEVERDNGRAELEWFRELWVRASAIEPPKYIPVGQWVIDAFDDARREAGQAVDEPSASGYKPAAGQTLMEVMEEVWRGQSLDEAMRPYQPSRDEPMDPMTAGEWLSPPADRYVQYGEAKVTVRPGETFADAWTREGR